MQTALQILRQLHVDRSRVTHPSLPEAVRVPGKYNDKTHNGLCKCAVALIELLGGEATKITTSGRIVTKCKTEVKGSGKPVYIPGTTKLGTPDVRATLESMSLYIECKVGKDQQRPEQKKVEIQATNAGGFYLLARNFEMIYNWVEELRRLNRLGLLNTIRRV